VVHEEYVCRNIYQDIENFNAQDSDPSVSKYHISIANDLKTKEFLTQQITGLKEWHVIRLTRLNIIGWAISCYFLFHPDSFGHHAADEHVAFKHHDTKRSAYLEHLTHQPVYPINSLLFELGNRLQTYDVPCDISIDYADMATYFENICPWQPNNYPEIALERDFKNGVRVRQLLQAHQSIEQSLQSD
jgi:hypothetical protein